METMFWVGIGLFAVAFLITAGRMVYLSGAFWRYLEDVHPREWTRIYADRRIASAFLSPLMKGDAAQFFWESREDFGDPKVGVLRAKVKQAFAVTIASLVALFIWGLIVGFAIPLLGGR
jgi:hypothetical protein